MVKYLGVEDSVNTCDCCGKSGLKKTVALDFDGQKMNYGVVCAGRAMGYKTKNAADVSAAASKLNELERIKTRVDQLRAKGEDIIYGRFYVGNTIKSRVGIERRSDKLIHAIYPK